ncbi:hypothetical protein BKI52_00700 [marine bacterium AO1-C]|nr:hypothetical protein BKI52_00700 [marine bacterium AO1-C]
MNTTLPILLTLNIVFWSATSQAQYVPQTKRQTEATNTARLQSIHIQEKQELVISTPVVFCDSLLMEDEATLKAAASLKSLTIYAQYCKIGTHCIISTRGRNGAQNVQVPVQGESGAKAADVNLHLNIYALGSLTIDANGGNGGNGEIPGLYGSGGHVNIVYYAPFVVNISKRKRRKRKKAVIVVRNKKGRMNLSKLRKLRDQEESNQLDGNSQLMRIKRTVDPKTKKTTISTRHNDNSIRAIAPPKNFGKNGTLVSATEKERIKKKDGKLSFKRLKDPIRSGAIKF